MLLCPGGRVLERHEVVSADEPEVLDPGELRDREDGLGRLGAGEVDAPCRALRRAHLDLDVRRGLSRSVIGTTIYARLGARAVRDGTRGTPWRPTSSIWGSRSRPTPTTRSTATPRS